MLWIRMYRIRADTDIDAGLMLNLTIVVTHFNIVTVCIVTCA